MPSKAIRSTSEVEKFNWTPHQLFRNGWKRRTDLDLSSPILKRFGLSNLRAPLWSWNRLHRRPNHFSSQERKAVQSSSWSTNRYRRSNAKGFSTKQDIVDFTLRTTTTVMEESQQTLLFSNSRSLDYLLTVWRNTRARCRNGWLSKYFFQK